MRKIYLFVTAILLPCTLLAQKTADERTVTFTKSTKSFVSYSGIGVEVYKPQGLFDTGNSGATGFGISYEAFRPLSAKTALTGNLAYKFFSVKEDEGNFEYSYKRNGIELNVGLHQLLVKGFYLKPQLGIGSIHESGDFDGDNIYSDNRFDGIFGLQSGYLINIKNSNRPKFIDLGLMYQGYFAGGSYLGLAAKYLLGPSNKN